MSYHIKLLTNLKRGYQHTNKYNGHAVTSSRHGSQFVPRDMFNNLIVMRSDLAKFYEIATRDYDIVKHTTCHEN